MHSFTQEDLVQYLYKETSQEKSAILRAALETDWILREKFEVISFAINSLENLQLSPRKITIDNILNYAKRSVKEHPTEV
jgi:predicted DNA-binding protein